MKQLILILLTMVSSCAYAQTGMHISALFEGKIVPVGKMVETRIRGKSISKYKGSYFHSVRFKTDEALLKKVDRLATADYVADSEKFRDRSLESHASSIDTSGKSSHSTRKMDATLMYELAPHGNTNRFLCYKVKGDVMTVIYMEGTVSSLEELRNIFKD